MSEVAHSHRVQVRWRDGDGQGHVNHAVLVTFLEEGRDSFLAARLGPDFAYAVVRVELDIMREVNPAEHEVRVDIEQVTLGHSSFTTLESVFSATGELVGRAKVVSVKWEQGHAVPLTQGERTSLTSPP